MSWIILIYTPTIAGDSMKERNEHAQGFEEALKRYMPFYEDRTVRGVQRLNILDMKLKNEKFLLKKIDCYLCWIWLNLKRLRNCSKCLVYWHIIPHGFTGFSTKTKPVRGGVQLKLTGNFLSPRKGGEGVNGQELFCCLGG